MLPKHLHMIIRPYFIVGEGEAREFATTQKMKLYPQSFGIHRVK